MFNWFCRHKWKVIKEIEAYDNVKRDHMWRKNSDEGNRLWVGTFYRLQCEKCGNLKEKFL